MSALPPTRRHCVLFGRPLWVKQTSEMITENGRSPSLARLGLRVWTCAVKGQTETTHPTLSFKLLNLVSMNDKEFLLCHQAQLGRAPWCSSGLTQFGTVTPTRWRYTISQPFQPVNNNMPTTTSDRTKPFGTIADIFLACVKNYRAKLGPRKMACMPPHIPERSDAWLANNISKTRNRGNRRP